MFDNIDRRRFLAMAIAAPVIVAFALGIGLYPMVHMEAKDVPVAVVSEDRGVSAARGQSINMGETLVMNIKEVGEKNGTMDISRISDKQKAVEEAEKGKFCAVMVIPEDFSMKQMALKSGAREAAEIRIYINQGSYGLLGTVTEALTADMTEQISRAFSPGSTAPVSCDIEYINPTDNMGSGLMAVNGHALAGMITWMSMLVSTVLLYIYGIRRADQEAAMKKREINFQLVFGIFASVVAAAAAALSLRFVMGFDIELGGTFCYLIVVILGFMLLILGIMRWIGFGGLVLAALAMFISIGTIYIPYEALPGFWQTFIYPWAPVRLMGEGFREMFFLGGSWLNRETAIAAGMGAAGAALMYLSVFKRKEKSEK